MRKRTVKILKIIAIVIIALSLIYAVAVVISSVKLRKAYATLEKAGRPMDPADVIPPDVPDVENAALLYESAILLLKAQPAPNRNLLKYLGGFSDKFLKESIEPDELAEFQKLIEQDAVNQAISVVEQGAQRRSCRFDHDYKAGLNMLMPNLGGFRNIIFILGAKSCLDAEAGRPDAAWNLVQTQLRLADSLRNEPILISFLVCLASIRSSCETIQRICEVAPPKAEQYKTIESLLSNYEAIEPLVLALDGERLLCGEWAFNLLKNGSFGELSASLGTEYRFGKMLPSFYSVFKPLFLADHAAYVRIMGDYTRLVQQPYSFNEKAAMMRQVDETRSRLYIITSIFAPAMLRVNELYAESIARMRITRVGLALLQEKKAQGVFPDTLEKLNMENLDDPFSTEPLRYKPQGQGFILYSIGPDQKDNGGSPKQKKQKSARGRPAPDDWDIVWSYTGGN
jgi:hypothetical protein